MKMTWYIQKSKLYIKEINDSKVHYLTNNQINKIFLWKKIADMGYIRLMKLSLIIKNNVLCAANAF